MNVSMEYNGEIFQQRREEVGLTSSQVAEQAGMLRPAYSRLESDRIKKPHRSTLEKVSAVLSIDPDTFNPRMEGNWTMALHYQDSRIVAKEVSSVLTIQDGLQKFVLGWSDESLIIDTYVQCCITIKSIYAIKENGRTTTKFEKRCLNAVIAASIYQFLGRIVDKDQVDHLLVDMDFAKMKSMHLIEKEENVFRLPENEEESMKTLENYKKSKEKMN